MRRIYNRLRHSHSLGLIGLLFLVVAFCSFLAVLVAVLLHTTLGLEYKDTMGFVTATVGAPVVVILVYLYFIYTGKTLTQPAAVPSPA